MYLNSFRHADRSHQDPTFEVKVRFRTQTPLEARTFSARWSGRLLYFIGLLLQNLLTALFTAVILVHFSEERNCLVSALQHRIPKNPFITTIKFKLQKKGLQLRGYNRLSVHKPPFLPLYLLLLFQILPGLPLLSQRCLALP